jgi:hypothetical protein
MNHDHLRIKSWWYVVSMNEFRRSFIIDGYNVDGSMHSHTFDVSILPHWWLRWCRSEGNNDDWRWMTVSDDHNIGFTQKRLLLPSLVITSKDRYFHFILHNSSYLHSTCPFILSRSLLIHSSMSSDRTFPIIHLNW